MSYRFVKISSYYRSFLKYYYSRNPGVTEENYETQFRHLMDYGVAWADFFPHHLENLGVAAIEILHNAEPMQKTWASEMGFNGSGTSIVLEQLKKFNPDVVLFQDTLSFSDEFITEIKREIPAIKLIMAHICSPFNERQLENYNKYDVILACAPLFHKLKDSVKTKLYEFNHGIEESLIEKIVPDQANCKFDISFIGSMIQSQEFHSDRIEILNEVVRNNFDIRIYSDTAPEKNLTTILKRSAYDITHLLLRLKMEGYIGKHHLGRKLLLLKERPKITALPKPLSGKIIYSPLYGKDMLEATSKSRIGINVHGGIAGDYAGNVRMFEITGCGSLLLTDYKRNIRDFFEPDKEIVCYHSKEDCIEKLKWLVNNPEERRIIAENGRKRILKDHTLKQRVKYLHEIIIEELKAR